MAILYPCLKSDLRSPWPHPGRSGKAIRSHPHVAELAEVLIEAGDWQIFSHGGDGDQAVHKMDLCSLEAGESV